MQENKLKLLANFFIEKFMFFKVLTLKKKRLYSEVL